MIEDRIEMANQPDQAGETAHLDCSTDCAAELITYSPL